MKKFLVATASMATLAVASPALAQEEAPFTGAHAEGLVGYDDTGSDDGVVYGGAIGYDFQIGGAILGIEGEITDSNADTTASDILANGDSASVNAGRDLYAGARIGFAVSPSTMIYGKAGYTNAKFKTRYDDGVGVITRDGLTADGYRLGAGIEQKFNIFGPSGFVKVEYRYSNYKNLDVGNFDLDIDADRHQVVAGVGVRF